MANTKSLVLIKQYAKRVDHLRKNQPDLEYAIQHYLDEIQLLSERLIKNAEAQ
jgi:uncharacterized short protein YbdD (DUF466 family)